LGGREGMFGGDGTGVYAVCWQSGFCAGACRGEGGGRLGGREAGWTNGLVEGRHVSQDLAPPSEPSDLPVTPTGYPPRAGGAGGLLAAARLQVQFYRPVPLAEFPLLRLAPDSAHKYEDGHRGGNFEIQPGFIQQRGGLVLWNAQGDYYGLFVDAEESTLAIESLCPHAGAGMNVVLRNRPEKDPITVSLKQAENKRYPVGKELRVVVVFKNGKPAVHFYNKSPEPMELLLFRANVDAGMAVDYVPVPAASAGATALGPAALLPRGVWNVARFVAARFNSTLIFFALAVGMVVTALVVRQYFVREYVRQVRGEPYAVNLERQHLGVHVQDGSSSHALGTQELSYPIYQALTFMGRVHSGRVEAVSVADVKPPAAETFDVRVELQGGESRTIRVDIRDAASLRELQDFIFGGNFEAAQMDAVAVPDILTTFFLLMFLASGLFLVWGVWQLWNKMQEITAGARIREVASPHKIIGSLDAEAQRNIGEKLGPDREEIQILGDVDDNQARQQKLAEDEEVRRKARGERIARADDVGL
jgi:hypothetical protein